MQDVRNPKFAICECTYGVQFLFCIQKKDNRIPLRDPFHLSKKNCQQNIHRFSLEMKYISPQ
ncbi:hypothetical protein DERF_006393 [Dermatophagoides farinae]|uniref:Uncharacterized protein n=1 Tax=Dermatophagoides farinae TaxID=6954 RepID=A0A922LC41_DERFA|nr:hypothetical protein DERF_006393 [Dermatophagoides farinae]